MSTEDRRSDDRELFQHLGRIEGKMDALDGHAMDMKALLGGVEQRVRSLEVSRGWIVGASAVAGALGGIVLKVLSP